MKICTVKECINKYHAKGLCRKHYDRFNICGNTDEANRIIRLLCSVEGCNRKHYSKSFCCNHYNKWKRYDDPNITKHRKFCMIEGCNIKHEGLGYCAKHYVRFRKYGDPLYKKPIFICVVNDCNKKSIVKEYCQKHYDKLRNHDDPLYEKQNTILTRLCNVDNCNKKYYALGYCKNHYGVKWGKDNPEKMLVYNIKQIEKLRKPFNISIEEYRWALLYWSRSIKKLDNNMCKICDSTEKLHAHHLFPKALFPEMALDINNGITLCNKCHYRIHGYDLYKEDLLIVYN